MDSLGRVVVAGGDDLDDFVTWELERGNVASAACHEISIQHSQHGFVGDDEEVVVFAFEFEDDGLKADGEVVVGLQ